MFENLALAPAIYPGWQVWVYCEAKHPATVDLTKAGAVVMQCPMAHNDTHWQGLFWRMRVCWNPNADRWIIRDADSRLNHKERAAVDAWIESGKSYHVMHEYTSGVFGGNGHKLRAILGGMWGGIYSPWIQPIVSRTLQAVPRCQYGVDETMMTREIWPRIKDDCLCHGVSTFWTPEGEWPEHEPIEGFIGEKIP